MKNYYPTIHFLRGIAALMVCLFHLVCYKDSNGHFFDPGSFLFKVAEFCKNGFFIFFVISAFVIPLWLVKDDFKPGNFHKFLLRRFIRIELPFFASILLVLSVSLFWSVKSDTPFIFHAGQFFYHLIYMIEFTDYGWYSVVYWTLAIEIQFYVFIAIFYFCLVSPQKILMYTGVILFLASGFIFQDPRFFFFYSGLFSAGISIYLLKSKRINKWECIMLLGLSVISIAMVHSIIVAAFCGATALLIWFLNIDHKVSNFLGEISYSWYLTHSLIAGNILFYFSGVDLSYREKVVLLLLTFSVVLVVAYLFWWLIERPSKNVSKRINISDKY